MKIVGGILVCVAVLLALGVIAIDPTVSSSSYALGRDRVYNNGLLASRDLLALAAATLFVAGTVLVAAGQIVEGLSELAVTYRASAQPETKPVRVPDAAPAPQKPVSSEAGNWLGAITKTEDYRGVLITFGYLGADVGGTYFKDKFEARKAIDAGAFLLEGQLVQRDGEVFVWRGQCFPTEDDVRQAMREEKV